MLSRHRAWASITRIVLSGALPGLLACASAPLPPQVSTASPAAVPDPGDAPAAQPPILSKTIPPPVPIPKAPKKSEPTTVVVEIGKETEPKVSDLVSIARAEKERRRRASAPSIVITNDTLVRRPGPKSSIPPIKAPAPAEPAAPNVAPALRPGADQESREALWRGRALDIRMRLKEAQDRTEKLRRLTASMRDRFYLAPPQLGRDDSLWQEWGRMQESLAEAQKESEETEDELETFLEEGSAAGAHPGWLAEGEDLFMDSEKEDGSNSIQPIEPPVIPPAGGWR